MDFPSPPLNPKKIIFLGLSFALACSLTVGLPSLQGGICQKKPSDPVGSVRGWVLPLIKGQAALLQKTCMGVDFRPVPGVF